MTADPAPPKSRRPAKVRRARLEDIPAIYACQAAAYASFPATGLCDERQLRLQLEAFPEGQFVAVRRGEIVGYAASLIVQLDEDSPWYSYVEITGTGTFTTHDPSGDTLYGADIAVHPKHRGKGIAGLLYEARKKLVRRLNLRRMVAGGRIPGYQAVAGKMTAEEYVERVIRGELRDPALNAHLKAGYTVRGVHMGYLRDEQSLDYATYLEWENTDFRSEQRRIAAPPVRQSVRKIRVCAAQYEMRPIRTWAEFASQVDFFVTTAEEYSCHFLVFPELFTVQLFETLPPKTEPKRAIEMLADMGDRYRDLMQLCAQRARLFIIGGSHPVMGPDGIRNVAHLFTPSGNVYTQDKLHVTPSERNEYGVQPGDGLKVFDTGFGRIAIQVCYDIEFPETIRLLTLAGAQVVFVPFSTDERRSYLRVRYTAAARAVENGIYTVLSGNVGNLPRASNFLINYGQSCVCTPSDFPFPISAVAGEADPNSETVVICDLDLDALETVREIGSVRQLRDRRPDLYQLEAPTPVEVIRVS